MLITYSLDTNVDHAIDEAQHTDKQMDTCYIVILTTTFLCKCERLILVQIGM